MKKNYCLYLFIFSVILLNILIIFSSYSTKKKQDNYFRLHVVANSNLIDDQIVKLNVSKKIKNYLNTLLKNNNSTNKDNSKEIITENIDKIIEIANSEIKMNNEDYTSYVNIGKIYYDEKHSDNIHMDKGIYDSIQVVLGEGKGENFWSLIFPYSYNLEFTEINDNDINDYIQEDKIEIKSGILEDIKKIVKFFS